MTFLTVSNLVVRFPIFGIVPMPRAGGRAGGDPPSASFGRFGVHGVSRIHLPSEGTRSVLTTNSR